MTPQLWEKLFNQVDRDIRNQVLINQFLKLNRRQKLMIALNRFNWILMTGAVFCLLFWLALGSLVLADPLPPAGSSAASELHVPCPTAEPCKILVLSAQEEKILIGQNGILDTAAQARSLDLGQFAVYLKTRIASAPSGEPQKPAENKLPAPVDSTPK